MTKILSNEAKTVLKSSIKNGIQKSVNDEGKLQRTPVISFKYYDANKDEQYICELSIVITSHKSKMKLSIDLSLEPNAVQNKYIGRKHNINTVYDGVNETINEIISTELSDYNVIPINISLKSAGVKPDKTIDTINYRGDSIACISYYDSIEIVFN